MLNRREQLALLVLTGVLMLGSSVAVIDYYWPDTVEDLQVLPAAVACPAAAPPADALPDSAAAAAVIAMPGAPTPISLNGATAVELEALPGIGAKLAARIVAHRDQHGPFSSVAELQQVPGIGAVTLARLAPLLEVSAVRHKVEDRMPDTGE